MSATALTPPFTFAGETMVPVLHCAAVAETLEFFQALGFAVTYRMTKPYLYLAFQLGNMEVHFGQGPAELDPRQENTGGCLVLVDTVEAYHRAFTAALRAHYGKVLARGVPRITRFRPGQSRFTLVDPSGNSIIFIQRGEPDIEYGGSASLTGLARALDNARVLREFKGDDAAAARALDSALKRHREGAPLVDLARALAARIELAVALDDAARAADLSDELAHLPLSAADRDHLAAEAHGAAALTRWRGDDPV